MGARHAAMGRGAIRGRRKIGWLTEGGSTLETADSIVTDMQFDLQGGRLPKDHGYLLFLELARLLPWLETEELAGIHHIQGSDTEHEELLLNRRAKLVIRAPKTRVADLTALTGQSISVGGHVLTIGNSKLKPITLHTPLYAHCVTTGSVDEKAFADDIIRLLDNLHIDSRFICGKRQSVRTAAGEVSGYSLMLHGIPIEHAIRIQELGLGGNRKLGCGIFIPHKSIQALS